MSSQFVEIIEHAGWGLAEPVVIKGRPHTAGCFNFRVHDALSIEASIRHELIRSLEHETLYDCRMSQFMNRIETAAGIPGGIRRLPPSVGLRVIRAPLVDDD